MSAAFFEAPQIRNAAVKIVAPADVNIQQDLQAGAQKSTQSPKKGAYKSVLLDLNTYAAYYA